MPREDTRIPTEQINISLREYESSGPLELSDRALRTLRTEVNTDDVERIRLSFDEKGRAQLTATQYVGLVSLSENVTIEIRPKAAGTNLLHLLRYAQDVESTTIEQSTAMRTGSTFIDTLGFLFDAELQRVVNRGLYREYQQTSGTERYVRGRLDVQQQLQRHGTTPTAFECTYDDHTYDTVTNQALLYATTVLLRLVSDASLRKSLRQKQQSLRRQVTLTPVRPVELEGIQLTRLNNYYANALRLTRFILQNLFVDDLQQGSSSTFSILVDMNRIFEKVIERALIEVVNDWAGWSVRSQETSRTLITGGAKQVTIRPDLLLEDPSGEVRVVGDVKWKLGQPSNTDFYQLSAYQLTYGVPGLLIYPEQDGSVASVYTVDGEYPLRLLEVPTRADVDSFGAYIARIRGSLEVALQDLISEVSTGSR
jgi:5-methylcytosine-specific restriction enzyme subunit McrC